MPRRAASRTSEELGRSPARSGSRAFAIASGASSRERPPIWSSIARISRSRSAGDGARASSAGAGGVAVAAPLGQVAPGQSLHDRGPGDRAVPGRGRADQVEDPISIGQGLVLDRPPEQQGDVRVVDVFGSPQQLLHDRQGDRPGESLAGACQLAPDRRARLALREFHEPVMEAPIDLARVAQQADGPGADVLGRVVEELQRQVIGQPAADVEGPEGLQGEPGVLPVAHHRRQARADGGIAPLREDASGLPRVPGVGVLQQVDQLIAGEPSSGGAWGPGGASSPRGARDRCGRCRGSACTICCGLSGRSG